jgi:hypothetical protein
MAHKKGQGAEKKTDENRPTLNTELSTLENGS